MMPTHRDLEQYPDGLTLSIFVKMASGRSSVRLGVGLVRALYEIAEREDMTVDEICSQVASALLAQETLNEALRAYVVNYFRDAATEDGHRQAGHGSRASKT